MAGYMGYRSKAEFEAALNREMARTVMHSSTGREMEREQQRRPKSRAGFRLRGEPGSAERWEQAVEAAGEVGPSLAQEAALDRVAVELQNAAHQIRAEEQHPDFVGEYSPETGQVFAMACRYIAASGNPRLYEAFAAEIEGTEAELYLEMGVTHAGQEAQLVGYDVQREIAQEQLDQRHEMLQREYSDISRRTGPVGLEAAHEMLTSTNEMLYDPNLDDDSIRGAARATAEAAAATQHGMDVMGFLSEFDKEVARRAGPGSRWSDEEREKWEAELRAGTVETVERSLGSPEQHDHNATLGMLLDDRARATGKSLAQEQVEHALDQHDAHSRENLPHHQAMADELVREFEQTHDARGKPTTAIDGQGREHGGRY